MNIIYNFLHISSQCLITFLGTSMITVITNNLQIWEQSATVQVQSTSRAPPEHLIRTGILLSIFALHQQKIRQSNEVARHCFPDGADYLGVTLSHFYDLLTVGNGFWNSDSTHKNMIIIFASSPLLFGATFLYKPKYLHIVDVLYIPLYSIVIHVPHHYIPLYSIIIPLYTPWYSIVFQNIALHSILFHIISEKIL